MQRGQRAGSSHRLLSELLSWVTRYAQRREKASCVWLYGSNKAMRVSIEVGVMKEGHFFAE